MNFATLAPSLDTFLEDLKSADLVNISVLQKNLGLRLNFTLGPECPNVAIELNHLVHLILSQPLNPDDQDFCYWVGEVELKTVNPNDSDILSVLSYPFVQKNYQDVDSSPLVYFRLEGDISLVAICRNYKLFTEIQ